MKETYKRDLQRRPANAQIEGNTYSTNVTERPTKETYKRDLRKRPTKETYKRDLRTLKRNGHTQSTKESYKKKEETKPRKGTYKGDTKKTFVRSKEKAYLTYKRDLRKRPAKRKYKRDLRTSKKDGHT